METSDISKNIYLLSEVLNRQRCKMSKNNRKTSCISKRGKIIISIIGDYQEALKLTRADFAYILKPNLGF